MVFIYIFNGHYCPGALVNLGLPSYPFLCNCGKTTTWMSNVASPHKEKKQKTQQSLKSIALV